MDWQFKIVIAKSLSDKRARQYMRITRDGLDTYHNFKYKDRHYGTKYGPYNTIKQPAVSFSEYKINRTPEEVNVIRELDIDVKGKSNSMTIGNY